MSEQQQNPNPYNPNPQQQGYAPNGYAPNGYAQQPQQQAYPQGWAPQQPAMPAPYGYAPQFAPRHKIPGGALAAAIIWIIYGSLQLIGVVANLAMMGRPAPSIVIGLGLGVMFLLGGIQASTGKLRGLLGHGITAIVLGALILIAFLALGSMFRGLGGGGAAGIIMLIGLVFGGLLATSGILACVSNSKYKEFHHTKFGSF